MPTTQRSASIAWLRVVAISGVVLIHVSAGVVAREGLEGTRVLLVAALMNGATRYCVPLFVLVSGALVLRPSAMKDGMGAFYRKRLSRLIPALIAWHLVYLAFRRFIRGEDYSIADVVVQLLTGRIYTALYFFWLILALYLIAPFLWKAIADLDVTQRVRLGLALIGLLCMWQTTLAVLAWQGSAASPGTPTIWNLWIPYIGYFIAGGALRDVSPNVRTGWLGLGMFVVGAGMTTWQVLGDPPAAFDIFAPFGYYSWFVAMATLGLWFAGRWFWREGTWASRGAVGRFGDTLGSLTLGVFAVHLLVLWFARQWLTPSLIDGTPRAASLLLLAAVVLAGSWAIAYGMSKVPGLRRIV